ncbi:hypothetical protein DFJ74DRAFT_775678 [Hyaloraphidium curvatum]|nr:hypothetical protein DFJ74DRAFT_775678 [Hyaloraphidium curvatum]
MARRAGLLAALIALSGALRASAAGMWPADASIELNGGPLPKGASDWRQCARLVAVNSGQHAAELFEGELEIVGGIVDWVAAASPATLRPSDEATDVYTLAPAPAFVGPIAAGESITLANFCVVYRTSWRAGPAVRLASAESYVALAVRDPYTARDSYARLSPRQAGLFYPNWDTGQCRCKLAGRAVEDPAPPTTTRRTTTLAAPTTKAPPPPPPPATSTLTTTSLTLTPSTTPTLTITQTTSTSLTTTSVTTSTSTSLTRTTSQSTTTTYTSSTTITPICVPVTPPVVPIGQSGQENSGYLQLVKPITPPGVNFTANSGGDGWDLGFHEDGLRVFNIYHHKNPWGMDCHVKSDGSRCAGYPWNTSASGYTIGSPLQSAVQFHPTKPNVMVSWVMMMIGSQSATAVMMVDIGASAEDVPKFVGVWNVTRPGYGSNPYSVGSNYGPSPGPIVDTKFYGFNGAINYGSNAERNAILCFDVATNKTCSGTPLSPPFWSGWMNAGAYTNWITLINNYFYVYAPGKVTGDATFKNVITCIGITGSPCPGTWPVNVTTAPLADGKDAADLFPYYNNTDVIAKGVCLGGSGAMVNNVPAHCWDFTGRFIGSLNTRNTGLRYYVTRGAMFSGTKLLLPSGGGVGCIDIATNGTCGSMYPTGNFAPASDLNSGWYRSYTITKETASCYWVNGDAGNIWNFDAVTGTMGCGNVPGGGDYFSPISLIDSVKCSQNVTGFTAWQLTSVNGLWSNATVNFFDSVGRPVPNWTGVKLQGAAGTPQNVTLGPNFPVGNAFNFEIFFSGLYCSNCSYTYKVFYAATQQHCCNFVIGDEPYQSAINW